MSTTSCLGGNSSCDNRRELVPECGGSNLSTIIGMQDLAAEKGGLCLSDNYVDALTKLRWQCSKNHIWEATPETIINGSWCPECARARRYTIEGMAELAAEQGGFAYRRNMLTRPLNSNGNVPRVMCGKRRLVLSSRGVGVRNVLGPYVYQSQKCNKWPKKGVVSVYLINMLICRQKLNGNAQRATFGKQQSAILRREVGARSVLNLELHRR